MYLKFLHRKKTDSWKDRSRNWPDVWVEFEKVQERNLREKISLKSSLRFHRNLTGKNVWRLVGFDVKVRGGRGQGFFDNSIKALVIKSVTVWRGSKNFRSWGTSLINDPFRLVFFDKMRRVCGRFQPPESFNLNRKGHCCVHSACTVWWRHLIEYLFDSDKLRCDLYKFDSQLFWPGPSDWGSCVGHVLRQKSCHRDEVWGL